MPSEHEAATRVAVEAMGERRRMRQAEAQRVEAAFEIRTTARSGMHSDPRRLVDDQYEPVAIEDAIYQLPLTLALSPRASQAGRGRDPRSGRGRGELQA